jgi:cytidylate kinase
MIIAIDGPAGSGKSSTAKLVAAALSIVHLDTGAMYRAVTLKCLQLSIPVTDESAISAMMETTNITFTGNVPNIHTWLDGVDVSDAIRSDEVTKNVSDYCAVPIVRTKLVRLQREIGKHTSVVCEGRDIGTVVFSNADLKFYMDASITERARRRQKDFASMGITKSIDELVEDIKLRDTKDSTRANSPLCIADDADVVDTTDMTLEQQAAYVVDKARKLQCAV